MCEAPLYLPDGKIAACRKCWQCIDVYKSDWAGRCIAESKVSEDSYAVTLTYRENEDNEIRAALLTYIDVQRALKAAHKKQRIRYLVAGEYGDLKGRSHWHALLFWNERYAARPRAEQLEDRIIHEIWDHGTTFWEKPNYRNTRYVTEYMQKRMDEPSQQCMFRMSKKPPLGYSYFVELAHRYVDAGLAPQNFKYWFGDVLNRNNEPIKFMMRGVTRKNFLKAYVLDWERRRGGSPPASEIVEEYLDEQVKYASPLLGINRYTGSLRTPKFPSWSSTLVFNGTCWEARDGRVTLYWRKRFGEQIGWHDRNGKLVRKEQ